MNEKENKRICALCGEKDADKKNTHYLTDSIIRTCLDYKGENERERGFFFNVSNDLNMLKYGFQRSTPPEHFKEKMGRKPTENEIEEAKKNPYSVDYVFCKDCEDLFGKIEKPFIDNLYKRLNELDLSQTSIVEVKEVNLIRLFFILQYWRCHVCNTAIKLNPRTAEVFLEAIRHYDSVDMNLLNKYPMVVSYIVSPEKMDHTSHFVGETNGGNPYIILMNDFVIQLFDNVKGIKYYSLYGVNTKESFLDFINYREDKFVIQIIQNNAWKVIAERYYNCELKTRIVGGFLDEYRKKIHCTPSLEEIKFFCNYYVNNPMKMAFSDEVLQKVTAYYFKEKYGI